MVDTTKLELNKITILNDYYYDFKRVNVEFYSQLESLNEREIVELFGYKFTKAFKLIDLLDEVYRNIIKDTINDIYLGDLSYEEGAPKSFYEIHIIDLPISPRSYNCLTRSDIKTLGAIIDHMDELPNIRNLGETSLKEINTIVNNYINNAKRKTNRDTNVYYNSNISLPLEKLNLSGRVYNCLKDANYNNLLEIIDYSFDDLLRIRNMGRKSAKELIEKIESFKNDYANHTLYSMITLLLSLDKKVKYFKHKDLSVVNFPIFNMDLLSEINIDSNISFINLYNVIIDLVDNCKITPKLAHSFYVFFNIYLKDEINDYTIKLDKRNRFILCKRVMDVPFKIIAEELELSIERVRQLYRKQRDIIKDYFKEKELHQYYIYKEYTSNNTTILNDELYNVCFYILDELLPFTKIIDNNNIKFVSSYGYNLGSELDNYGTLTEQFDESATKYDCRKITEYCRINNKELKELSQDEINQFIIK